MPSLSAVRSENDFQQYCNAKLISSRVSEYSQPQPSHCLAAMSGRSAGLWGEGTQAPSSGDFGRAGADYWGAGQVTTAYSASLEDDC